MEIIIWIFGFIALAILVGYLVYGLLGYFWLSNGTLSYNWYTVILAGLALVAFVGMTVFGVIIVLNTDDRGSRHYAEKALRNDPDILKAIKLGEPNTVQLEATQFIENNTILNEYSIEGKEKLIGSLIKESIKVKNEKNLTMRVKDSIVAKYKESDWRNKRSLSECNTKVNFAIGLLNDTNKTDVDKIEEIRAFLKIDTPLS